MDISTQQYRNGFWQKLGDGIGGIVSMPLTFLDQRQQIIDTQQSQAEYAQKQNAEIMAMLQKDASSGVSAGNSKNLIIYTAIGGAALLGLIMVFVVLKKGK